MTSPIKTEEEYNTIMSYIKGERVFLNKSKHYVFRLKKKSGDFIVIDNFLFLKSSDGNHKKVLIQSNLDSMRLEVVNIHNDKHYGQNRMYNHCKALFFSVPRVLIRDVVSKCDVCIQSQPLKQKEGFKHVLASSNWERIMIDLIDMRKYKEQNNNLSWILTIIDVYSKYAITYSLESKTANAVTSALQDLFSKFGHPAILHCDNGKEFKNSTLLELTNKLKIKMVHGRPRHPQSQGQIERFNQTLTRYLAKHLLASSENNKGWYNHIHQVVTDYNIVVHSATGKSPFDIFFARKGFNTTLFGGETDIYTSDDSVEEMVEQNDPSLCTSLDSFRTKYNQRMDKCAVHFSKYDFEVGDYVFLKRDFDTNAKTSRQKLDSFYYGSSKILEILSNNRLKIDFNGECMTVAMNMVKKASDKNKPLE